MELPWRSRCRLSQEAIGNEYITVSTIIQITTHVPTYSDKTPGTWATGEGEAFEAIVALITVNRL